jgi:hypothetical protein
MILKAVLLLNICITYPTSPEKIREVYPVIWAKLEEIRIQSEQSESFPVEKKLEIKYTKAENKGFPHGQSKTTV